MKYATKNASKLAADIAICTIFENDSKRGDLFNHLNTLSKNQLEQQLKNKIISAKYLEIFKLAINDKLKAIVVGLGKKEELTRKKYSIAIATAARSAKKMSKNGILALELTENKDFNKKEAVKIALSASRIGLYEFDKYLKSKDKKIETIEVIDNKATLEIEAAALVGGYSAMAMNFVKDLVNEPAQNATPEYIANLAQKIAKENKLEIKVFNKQECKKMGMNAFLAVGQGSINEPKFIHLTYKPKGTPKKKIALVGKGITFDAGGMNIKPAASMLNMKDDMTGAASVLGIIQAISKLKANIELHVISALCENMTSGKAYKQGDVLTAMNGKTIEVDNTDAEGRITLADALSYADTLEVDEVIDIATLTGAVIVSLGNNITGVMGNNQKQIDKFLKISKDSCENTWQMPILEELKDNLKSEIADFKNTGGRLAGTSTAAWFLSNFTKSKSWMHLDIAGTAYLDKTNKETLQGPTGVMVRSLINYLLS